MYKRPEKELDPTKYPGQIVNRPSGPDTLQHNIAEWEKYQRSKCNCAQNFYKDGFHAPWCKSIRKE
jgi:hypothetical protein